MTSKTIQTITGNQIEYKVIKDGYKTVSEVVDVEDSLPARSSFNLEPSTVVHGEDLTYTVDTDHTYPPVIEFNPNVETADGEEIAISKYILAPYGQDYLALDGQSEDNFTRIGNINISKDGLVSNLSSTSYLQLPNAFNPGDNSWEIILKIKFGSSNCFFFGNTNNTYGIVLGRYKSETSGKLIFFLSSNNTSWNIASSVGDLVLEDNTEYYIKISYDLATYKLEASADGVTWQTSASVNSSERIYQSTFYLGSCWDRSTSYFDGLIDLSESYIKINNEYFWQPTWDKLPNNYRVGGDIYVNNNIASNLKTWLAPNFTPTTENWEFTTKIYTGSELTSHHNQILHNSTKGYAMAITRRGTTGTPMSSYINNTWTNGTTSLSANTWYWFRFSCANRVCKLYITRYTSQTQCPAASSMTLQCTVTANESFIGDLIVISVANSEYWGGQIDLKQTHFIEGDYIWDFKSVNNINANLAGDIVVSGDKKLSNFSASNYAQMPKMFNPGNNTWEMVFKFKQDSLNNDWRALFGSYYSDFSSGAHLFVTQSGKIAFELTSNNSSWNIADQSTTTSVFSANRWYWAKLEFTGTKYNAYISEDGTNFNQILTVSSTTPIKATQKQIIGCDQFMHSGHYLNGSIDLVESYIKINGEYWWKGSEQCGEFLPGILDSSIEDTGDETTYNLYDVETTDRTLILNNNRDVTVAGKQFVQYDGQVTIPDHGLSLYDEDVLTWTKYRFITLEVDDPDTTLYITGNID